MKKMYLFLCLTFIPLSLSAGEKSRLVQGGGGGDNPLYNRSQNDQNQANQRRRQAQLQKARRWQYNQSQQYHSPSFDPYNEREAQDEEEYDIHPFGGG
ncbi:MAG: hypothetical protein S4CHLAM2_12250 [Chlamydiales bacterium]|nr:hypothetical protein [Chlamydiales bacterium]